VYFAVLTAISEPFRTTLLGIFDDLTSNRDQS
jgi:hypothetical protein